MTYFDFDGVILDTEPLLFEKWRQIPDRHLLTEEDKIKYIQEADWNYILNNAKPIDDSIYYLKQMNPKTNAILTKFHSLENEGYNKILWKLNNDIKLPLILVPYLAKKNDMVIAEGNFLIDDCLINLDEWKDCGGNPIFFDMDDDNIDSWNKPNVHNYPRVLSLSKFK